MHQPGSFNPTPVAELFPNEDYRLHMRFSRSEPSVFFGPTPAHDDLMAERRRWLRESPATHSDLLPVGEPLLSEVVSSAQRWHGFESPPGAATLELCRALGEFWESDFLLLQHGTDGEIRLLGGCLCFPSHWRLTDKMGKPIEFIHSAVPGLNASLGDGIHKFLAGLKPGVAWQRVNWGLSRSAELNQHPDRSLPRLDAITPMEDIWLRVEEQALVALPESRGILFGIRVVNHRLAEVAGSAPVRLQLARAIETMSEALARYKNLYEVRPRLVDWLKR